MNAKESSIRLGKKSGQCLSLKNQTSVHGHLVAHNKTVILDRLYYGSFVLFNKML